MKLKTLLNVMLYTEIDSYEFYNLENLKLINCCGHGTIDNFGETKIKKFNIYEENDHRILELYV